MEQGTVSQHAVALEWVTTLAQHAKTYIESFGYLSHSDWLEPGLHASVHIVDKSVLGIAEVGLSVTLYELQKRNGAEAYRAVSGGLWVTIYGTDIKSTEDKEPIHIDPVFVTEELAKHASVMLDKLRVRHAAGEFEQIVERSTAI